MSKNYQSVDYVRVIACEVSVFFGDTVWSVGLVVKHYDKVHVVF